MELLLSGDHPILENLRRQYRTAGVIHRSFTGRGFFTKFKVGHTPKVTDAQMLAIDDVFAEIDCLELGAGLVLFVVDGWLDELEAYSFQEPWPDPLGYFALRYFKWPRDLEGLLKPVGDCR